MNPRGKKKFLRQSPGSVRLTRGFTAVKQSWEKGGLHLQKLRKISPLRKKRTGSPWTRSARSWGHTRGLDDGALAGLLGSFCRSQVEQP